MSALTAGNFSGLNSGDKRMRKKIISPAQLETGPPDLEWLNLDELAEVELTSEDAAHPIEAALLHGQTSGWRAAASGEQKILILFNNPQHLRRIWLNFVETQIERTQEFVLRWSADGGESFREIVRQQWNFSPLGATGEIENLHVDLPAVTTLELSIVPDISGGSAFASLQQLRVA
jgi:hypothetical protein